MPSFTAAALPWNDRLGRFDVLRAATLVLLALPALWLLWTWWSTGLGARPINDAMRFLGSWTVRLLLAAMSVTPLRLITGWTRLLGIRRMLGLGAFFYIVAHLCLYIVDQKGDLAKVAGEIAARSYLTIGFAGLVGLSVLAATSFDRVIAAMGALNWTRLHRLVHPVMVLAMLHFFMQAKLDVSEPAVMAGLFLFGEGVRIVARRWRRPGAAVLALTAVAAGILTAVLEALWYGLATKVDGWMVWAGNIEADGLRLLIEECDPALLRPAWIVCALSLSMVPLVLARRRRPGVGR